MSGGKVTQEGEREKEPVRVLLFLLQYQLLYWPLTDPGRNRLSARGLSPEPEPPLTEGMSDIKLDCIYSTTTWDYWRPAYSARSWILLLIYVLGNIHQYEIIMKVKMSFFGFINNIKCFIYTYRRWHSFCINTHIWQHRIVCSNMCVCNVTEQCTIYIFYCNVCIWRNKNLFYIW